MSESTNQNSEKFTVSIRSGLATQIRNHIASNPGTNTSHIFEEALEFWCRKKYEQHLKVTARMATEKEKKDLITSIGNLHADENQELDPDQLFGRY